MQNLQDLNITIDENMLAIARKFSMLGRYNDASPFLIAKWIDKTKQDKTSTTSYAKYYLGKIEKQYSDDDMSYVLTEALKDTLSVDECFCAYGSDEKVSISDYVNPNDYEIKYITGVDEPINLKCFYPSGRAYKYIHSYIIIRNKILNKNIGLVHISSNNLSESWKTFHDRKLPNTRLGSRASSMNINKIMHTIMYTIMGTNAMMPITHLR